MKLNVAEFRKQIREALDAVERGEEVYITRHNKTFAIIKAPFNLITTNNVSSDIKPEKKSSGATPQPLATSAEPLPACCSKRVPCKHWEFNELTQEWVNSINGERKGVI